MKKFSLRLWDTTKRFKASIIDFVELWAFSELVIFLMMTVSVDAVKDWKYFVVIPIYFITLFFVIASMLKINKIMWEYTGLRPFFYVALALFASACITFGLTGLTLGFTGWMGLTIVVLFFVSFTILALTKLLLARLYVRKHQNKHKDDSLGDSVNTAIIGAGWTGTNLATSFKNDPTIFKPICFIDDNSEKIGMEINEIPVVGNTNEIEKIVQKYNIKKIIFAIPSCPTEIKKRIINDCVKTKCVLKVVPPLQELVDHEDAGKIRPRDLRIEDLLGREQMRFDNADVKENIAGKVVLVTGGGGSIGSELCRQIASFNPKQLIIMDIYENNAYDIQMELKRHFPELNLVAEICSIADYDKCRILFERYKPELVFHAAAHKHVPLMEHVPEQAIKNNVVGTWNLCALANEFNVSRFLLISTDKAVNPTNVMGASKRCCEMVVKYHAQISKGTVFCAVRFGNVLGSNGSVIPLFKRQIAEGGPITLTDKNIIRYFMTIPEAVSLVLEAGTLASSGEIFVLDMGDPVRILDLAENMIKLSGLTPYEDIDIVFTGLRPGEKLFEELLISGEGMTKTANKKIFICQQIDVKEKEFIEDLDTLFDLAKNNKAEDVVKQLHKMIPTYKYPEVQD